MTRGSKTLLAMILALAVPAAAYAETSEVPPGTGAEEIGPVRGVFLPEAYYHFFLSDYLTAATRLRLIEKKGADEKDPPAARDVRTLLGSLYFSWGMDRTARGVFSGLVSGLPEGVDRNRLLYELERVEYGRGLYGPAVASYGSINPEHPFPEEDHARYIAGMSYRAVGSPDRSIEILRSVSPSSPYRPFSQYAAAQARTELKTFPEAIRDLEDLAGMKTGKDPVLGDFRDKSRLTLGQLYLELGEDGKALETLSGISPDSPFRPEALYTMGWARFNSGKIRDALLDFEELIRIAPDHPYAVEALTVRANCYARLAADRSALIAYKEAMDDYVGKSRAYAEAKTWVRDDDRLRDWLARSGENPPVVSSLLQDETLRYRIGQYRDLVAFESYFNRKLADMDVFDVMLKHRESVFAGRVPDVEKFMEGNAVEKLGGKDKALRGRFDDSLQAESGVLGILTRNEVIDLKRINAAREKVRRLGIRIESLPQGPERRELSARLKAVDRWLAVFRGRILWDSITTLPGRSDDTDRAISGLTRDIEKLKNKRERLLRSVTEMRARLAGFEAEIPRLTVELRRQLERTVALRERMLPPLRAMMLKTIDERMGYYDRLTAYARFGQIQVMDRDKK